MQRTLNAPRRKPLLGFGPIGWPAMALALLLALCLSTSYDLRYQVLRLATACFGPDAAAWIVNWLLLPHHLDLMGWPRPATFGLIEMGLLLIAMRIHPRTFGPGPYTAVILGGLLLPCIQVILSSLRRQTGLDFPVFFPGETIRTAFSLAVLGYVTRSWQVVAITGVFHAAWLIAVHDYDVYLTPTATGQRWVPGSEALVTTTPFAWTWNLVTITVILWWAIAARRRLPPPGHCPRCGYDLAGLAGPCPECGPAPTPQDAAPAPAPDRP